MKQAVQRHPDFIVGLKARMSSSVVGENGITPLARAKAIQQENDDLPLMVHIGNNPPNLDEIADLLSSGDIITHCYNGKPNRILNPAGELRSSITRALQRGVRLDVGHGTPASALRWRGGRLRWAFCRTPLAPIFTAATGSTARCARWRW